MDLEGADTLDDSKGTPDRSWPFVKVLDVTACLLVVVVVARAAGGLATGVGYNADLGSSVPAGTSGIETLPTYIRLEYGTGWADISSGLILLAVVGLLALPRLAWDVKPADQWRRIGPWLLVVTVVVATMTAAAGVTNTVNSIWNALFFGGIAEGTRVADALAAVMLSVLALILAWCARPLVARLGDTEPPDPESTQANPYDV